MSFVKKSLIALAVAGTFASQANASPIGITYGGTGSGTNFENFDELALGLNSGTIALPNLGATVTLHFNNSQIAQGNATNLYQTPFADSTQYLATFGGGHSTFTFNSPINYIGFTWGSVDPYNSISFYDASNNLIDTIGGATIIAGAGLTASDPGVNGSVYANFTSATGIAKIIMNSSINAFEVDNISVAQLPLPAALPMFGAALMGLGGFRKKFAAKA